MNRKSSIPYHRLRTGLAGAAAILVITLASSVVFAGPSPLEKKRVYRFNGHKHFEEQGLTIHSAGDRNGDGVEDIITGLRTMPTNSPGNKVSARIYSGKNGDLLREIDTPGHLHSSPNPVADLGDLDKDNRSEVIVGTPDAGVARIFSSKGGLLLATLSKPASSKFGAAVNSAGDVNGDGIPDIIVGAPAIDTVFVYSGEYDLPTPFPLIAEILSESENIHFGASVATAGRIQSRRNSGVVIGAPLADEGNPGDHKGCVFVYLVDDEPRLIHQIFGQNSYDLLGTSVDGGFNVDDDDIPDFLAGAVAADLPPPKGSGQVGNGYVDIYSGATGSLIRKFPSDQIGDLWGISAQFGGPCEEDLPTVVIGAPLARKSSVEKISGRVLLFDAVGGTQLAEIYGENKLSGMGMGVGGFADITGDGRAEFLAGSNNTNPPGFFGTGTAFVFSCVDIPRPDISTDPNPVLLGSTALGSGTSMEVNIINEGDAELQVQSLQFATGSSSAFSVSGAVPPFTIDPDPLESQAITISFNPATAGVHSGKLEILSNDPDESTYEVPVMGNCTLIQISVDPASVNFGSVDLGENKGAIVTVKNTGTEPLSVLDIQLSGGDFVVSALPFFPKTIPQTQSFAFMAGFTPSVLGAASATIQISSNDPATPVVEVPLNGAGTTGNQKPTAVIAMDVPYLSDGPFLKIPFRGDQSFDTPPFPQNQVLKYSWDFGGLGTSTDMNKSWTFNIPCPVPCLSVVRLEVTDEGFGTEGPKSDSTSVTVISFGNRPLRSRFYGQIKMGEFGVPPDSVIEAWVKDNDGNDQMVASSRTQVHHGKSVYAIEVPPRPSLTEPGGYENAEVVFKYRISTANEKGTWYSATDQELDLTLPLIKIFNPGILCLPGYVLYMDVCVPEHLRPDTGLLMELIPIDIPNPDPGPLLTLIGQAFELNFFDGNGRQIERFEGNYEIKIRYTDLQLEEAGVADESSLGLHVINGDVWSPAGRGAIDFEANEVVTSLNHASVFALLGRVASPPPVFRRADCNDDGSIDISDAIATLWALFVAGIDFRCEDACDSNDDGDADLSDVIATLEVLFRSGPMIPLPGMYSCGVDPTDDRIGCETFEHCP